MADNIVNQVNNILFTPKEGIHKGKNYLFTESNKRFSLLRNYVSKRPIRFKNERWFLISGLKGGIKWEFSNYSNSTPYTKNVPLPEVIYDIHNDKVYEFQGQLWTLK